jgi:hypothetical protein
VKRILVNNGLSIVLLGAFVVIFVGGQSFAGLGTYNEDQRDHGEPTVTYWGYLRTSHFGEATFENWESEFLQMGAYVLLTVWLRQRGSAESKPLEGSVEADDDPAEHRHEPGAPWPVRRGGWVLWFYKNSLALTFFTLFVLAWVLHAITGAREYSAEQVEHGAAPVTTIEYLQRARFWFESFQNWQSEFLAVGAIVVLSIFLRQFGSPESKPVHARHADTGN